MPENIFLLIAGHFLFCTVFRIWLLTGKWLGKSCCLMRTVSCPCFHILFPSYKRSIFLLKSTKRTPAVDIIMLILILSYTLINAFRTSLLRSLLRDSCRSGQVLDAGLTVNGLKKRFQLHHIRFAVGPYPAAEVGAEGRSGGLMAHRPSDRLPAVFLSLFKSTSFINFKFWFNYKCPLFIYKA